MNQTTFWTVFDVKYYIKNVLYDHWLLVKSEIYHCAGLIITGGNDARTDVEVFPAKASCTIPPFPSPGKLSSCSSSHCNCCQREMGTLPLCDQQHPCGVRWVRPIAKHQDLVHIVEERPGRLGGLPYFEVKLCASITNTSDNDALKMILWSSKQLLDHLSSKKHLSFQPREVSSRSSGGGQQGGHNHSWWPLQRQQQDHWGDCEEWVAL